ncbi:hypothetical protein Ccrd_013194, partial [Cynara cardunculus var. scolymus]
KRAILEAIFEAATAGLEQLLYRFTAGLELLHFGTLCAVLCCVDVEKKQLSSSNSKHNSSDVVYGV